MTPWHSTLIFFVSSFSTISTIVVGMHKRGKKLFYEKVEYLNDCPFKFHPESKNGYNYIVFDLGNDTTLWCEYVLGIRSDGIYGVSYLKLMGLNGHHYKIKLKIGQSVFPIIESINTFDAWTKEKIFETQWDGDFVASWNDMKKKLDNLRILEAKSKEKEVKEKKSKNG